MERIKEALARANAERNRQTPESDNEWRNDESSLDFTTESIRYSRTKVVRPSDAIWAENRLLPGISDDAIQTAYKILRTQVEQRLTANGWNAMAVTSPTSDQGKTLTAMNLAISLALEMHRTVLLVDLDLRNPSIHRRLGYESQLGIADYLLDGVPLTEIMVNPGVERLVVLPGSRQVLQSSELLSSPKMHSLVNELKGRYPDRIIIFDLPPMLSTDDTLAFSPFVDCALMVIEDGKTTKQEVVRALEMLGSTELIGTVLNQSREKQSTYYSG